MAQDFDPYVLVKGSDVKLQIWSDFRKDEKFPVIEWCAGFGKDEKFVLFKITDKSLLNRDGKAIADLHNVALIGFWVKDNILSLTVENENGDDVEWYYQYYVNEDGSFEFVSDGTESNVNELVQEFLARKRTLKEESLSKSEPKKKREHEGEEEDGPAPKRIKITSLTPNAFASFNTILETRPDAFTYKSPESKTNFDELPIIDLELFDRHQRPLAKNVRLRHVQCDLKKNELVLTTEQHFDNDKVFSQYGECPDLVASDDPRKVCSTGTYRYRIEEIVLTPVDSGENWGYI